MLNLHLPRAVGAWLSNFTGQASARGKDGTGDTVMHWPPTAARVLASSERHAHRCIAPALALEHPRGFLLAHVPLHKLVRVPRHYSYREWLSRTGLLTVDFALCDEHGHARSVVLLPLAGDPDRHSRKRERLLRVLAATELAVAHWEREWLNDSAAQLRERLFPKAKASGYYADLPHSH